MIRGTRPIPSDSSERLDRLGAVPASDERVRFAHLFGSLARGRATKRSGIDIAAYLTDDSLSANTLLDLQALLTTGEVDRALAEADIVPPRLVPDLIRMAGFRSTLVQRCEKLDPELVVGVLRNNLDGFLAFTDMRFLP